ncbi:hypothetical protein BYT27DRAFT_7239602 [Phlegmacium glaucopus]|nr:hypothetical protein BYT27DRAFT_7239602 [Phlegmacium glaucopus]
MLVNIPLDLQITICTFLYPSDILALRQTCKSFQLPTRQRFIWVDALRQVCLDNTLFLPSFPIPNMTVVELEHAAMAPRRWIELCTAFENDDSGAKLCARTTRIINNPLAATARDCELFIVPGGRYLVGQSPKGVFVWDLGYTSSADCKLIASVECKSYYCMVQATPDDMGLIIFSSRRFTGCSVYEIYPQSETPQLTEIARLDINKGFLAYLLPDKVIWYGFCNDNMVVRVWDFRRNYSTSFSADVDAGRLGYITLEVLATRTAIIVLCKAGMLVWAIPPLSPQPLDFSDYNPTHIPPLVRIPFPDGIFGHTELFAWKRTSYWYLGSSQPLYFDLFFTLDSGKADMGAVHRFKIIVEPDLYDTSLHFIYTSEVVPNKMVFFLPYRICEDTLVTYWYTWCNNMSSGCVYTGLTSSRVANGILHGSPAVKMLLPWTGNANSLCPASGKFVHLNSDRSRIVIVDGSSATSMERFA